MVKKRILVVTPSLNHYGGGSNVLFKTLKNLETKYQFKVLVPRKCELLYHLRKKGFDSEIYRLHENVNYFNYILAVIKAIIFLKKNKTDLLFLQDYIYWKPAEITAAKILNIPIISQIHGTDPGRYDYRSFLSLSDKIISVSKFRASILLKTKFRNKVKVIHNFEDTKKISGGERFKQHPFNSKNKFIIGFMGRLRFKKGVMVLLESAKLLRNEKDIIFVIFGSGIGADDDCSEEAKAFVRKHNLENKVFFRGFIERNNLPDVYKSLDVLVVPSIFNDSFPCTVIEGMAAGLPVIASKIGGIPEQIEDLKSGILVDPNNPEAIRDNILLLLKNKELRNKIKTNAKEKVKKEFNESIQTKKFDEVFSEMLKPRIVKPNKILIINQNQTYGGGGTECLVDLLNSINRKRFDICLMLKNNKDILDGIKQRTTQRKIVLHSFNNYNNPIQYLIELIKFMRFLIVKRIKLVYLQDFGITWKPAELLATKILRIPLICHLCALPEECVKKSFITFSEVIIGNSNFTLSPLKDTRLPTKRIYNSLNLKRLDTNKPMTLKKGHLKFAFVGRVRKRKGVMIFVNAAIELLKKYKKIHFFIVGDDKGSSDGCLEEAKELVKKKGMQTKFTFTGLVKDAPSLMRSMDVIVVPSIVLEAFGRVIIEGMAAKKAVIATNVGGIPEIIEHKKTGLLVHKNDSIDLAQAMEILIKNPILRKKLGINGRKHVEKNFDSNMLIRNIEQTFEKCIKNK